MPEHRELDVHHLGTPRVICAHVVDDVLVDPGPESAHERLLAGLGDLVPRAILLTHIHFDHAGATGRLVARWPGVPVYVHERGARYLVDPERLVASARRLYGDDFDRLWGEVVPVPQSSVHVLQGGEDVLGFRVAYAPGHASHHVVFLHEASGLALAGDVAGVRIGAGGVLPPTPPPDIDLEAWRRSVGVLRDWDPAALAITHFGTFPDVREQLDALLEHLDEAAEQARRLDAEGFATWVEGWIRAHAGDAQTAVSQLQAMPPETLYGGLHRYWTKRAEAEAGSAAAPR